MMISLARTARLRQIFVDTGAYLTNGHFAYTPKADGKWWHGATYIDKQMLYAHPALTADVCGDIAQCYMDPRGIGVNYSVVAGAATGGIVLAQWIAYNSVHIAKQGAEIHAVYADKRDGGLRFRDSYASLLRGKLVLAAEDIINSGHSLRLLIKEIQRCGGIVIGAAALWNRGDPLTAAMLDVPEFHCLLGEPLVSWPAETCPLCASGEIPLNLEVGHGQEYLNYLATKS